MLVSLLVERWRTLLHAFQCSPSHSALPQLPRQLLQMLVLLAVLPPLLLLLLMLSFLSKSA